MTTIRPLVGSTGVRPPVGRRRRVGGGVALPSCFPGISQQQQQQQQKRSGSVGGSLDLDVVMVRGGETFGSKCPKQDRRFFDPTNQELDLEVLPPIYRILVYTRIYLH